MLSSGRNIDLQDIFSYELAPVPTSMFTQDGMRICTAKSKLKHMLQVEVPQTHAANADIIVIDGSALLWTIHWPVDGTVADFVENVKTRLAKYLYSSDVYLVFDRYYENSIKTTAREERQSGVVSRKHHLLRSTKLPAQKTILSSTENKKQLVAILCDELTGDRIFHHEKTFEHKLVVTGESPIPIEIHGEDIRHRDDLETHQEEADTIIVQQVLENVNEACQISVISDDTDVFVLLLYHYQMKGLSLQMNMISPKKNSTAIDIKQTATNHHSLISQLLPAHALSGCDTVASMHGIGKGTVLKAIKDGCDLSALGNKNAPLSDVIEQASSFISSCYGVNGSKDMTFTRLHVWLKKSGKGQFSATNLSALPPTREAFCENVKRAHLQTMLWRNLRADARSLKAEEFGWKMENNKLTPIPSQNSLNVAPEYILKLIKCGCKSVPVCRSRCSCKEKNLPCTNFCGCFRDGCSRAN